MYVFSDDFGLPVALTFDPQEYQAHEARHVLIFPFWRGKLLFTRHRERGIELPGGKVEPGESSLAAAVRETFEETGAILDGIQRIGQYTVGDELRKDIYVALVQQCSGSPTGSDVWETVMFDEIPAVVKGNPAFSRLLYDEVYPRALAQALQHPFAK
jgi:8-oxo-dGTP diphosphatase